MSFGKDPGQVARIGGYGASTAQQMAGATRKSTGGRRGPPSWVDNYKPSLGAPDTIRILEGSYDADRIDDQTGQAFVEKVPWYEYTEHYSASNRQGIICSAGPHRMDRHKRNPCRGCDTYWSESKDHRTVSMASKYAFNVLIYGHFYKAPQLDRNGRPRTSNKGEPYMYWKKYEGPHQDHEYSTAPEHQEGLVQSWPVGHNHFVTLTSYAELIQKHCLNCGGMNCIYTQQWVCPACNVPVLDTAATSLSPEALQELVSQPHSCRNCGAREYPRAVQGCQSCGNPRSARLYDCDLQIQRVRQGQTQYQLLIPQVHPPRAIDPRYAELLKKAPDLPKKFSVTPMERQVEIFGHPVPEGGAAPYAPAQHGAPAPAPAPTPQQYAFNYGAPQPQPQQGAVPYTYHDPTQQYTQSPYPAAPAPAPTQAGTQPPGPGGYGGNYGGQQ